MIIDQYRVARHAPEGAPCTDCKFHSKDGNLHFCEVLRHHITKEALEDHCDLFELEEGE